ncbi:MAG: hypothetical protein R2939_12320 [Kofleriaceae bacterium]
MLALGLAAASRYRSPLGEHARTAELVRAAIATLRDPQARLLAEVWARAATVPTSAAPEPAPARRRPPGPTPSRVSAIGAEAGRDPARAGVGSCTARTSARSPRAAIRRSGRAFLGYALLSETVVGVLLGLLTLVVVGLWQLGLEPFAIAVALLGAAPLVAPTLIRGVAVPLEGAAAGLPARPLLRAAGADPGRTAWSPRRARCSAPRPHRLAWLEAPRRAAPPATPRSSQAA